MAGNLSDPDSGARCIYKLRRRSTAEQAVGPVFW
jgi:hypothetical protein